ncbi:MAG: 3-deoxy-7-phosphoheptulonate synthase [Deltaproteobacteria bacterium]|nr:MAG: 3-deoxy-7-phosphoheptulonate synthase [Deltaproteobacteria bacterium]
MIITIDPSASEETVAAVEGIARRHPGVRTRRYDFEGAQERVVEIHLIGNTRLVPKEPFAALPGVLQVVRVSHKYRLIGRHEADARDLGFTYNGVTFDRRTLNVLAGLCAVDTPAHVEAMLAALAEHGVTTTRMGAYKPRTSPYDFQGLGAACLPWVFELAGKYGIRVIAMEVTDARHLEEIARALEEAGQPTGVMVQIGTRNAQNFELLRQVGQQRAFPVLFKRGMGITLEESLNAAEYVATEGNPNIVFCLRGVKTHLGDPHRNLVDFGHVPVVRRQTRLPVCIDPSHSVGRAAVAPDGLPDIFHVTGQGLIAGATCVLVDFHPAPSEALCDGPQALTLDRLGPFLEYCRRVHETWRSLVDTISIREAHAESEQSPPDLSDGSGASSTTP